jgi:hypothetical protein
VKYPYYVNGITGSTYGIPFMDSNTISVYNAAAPRGFFTGDTENNKDWSALTNNSYVINSNYVVDISELNGTNKISLKYFGCNPNVVREPKVGDIVTIYYDGFGEYNCNCYDLPTPTPTPTPSITPTSGFTTTPTPTPTKTNEFPCLSQTPTPSPTETFCPTPTPSSVCPTPPDPNCLMAMFGCYPILTYRITDICLNQITLDRPTPDFGVLSSGCYARVLVYPEKFTDLYDSLTPLAHWNENIINYESICAVDEFDVKVWNMNIPWSENPAGLNSNFYKGYDKFGSTTYLGTKEYFGYGSNSGQSATTEVYIVNSLDDRIVIKPEEQKAIAIVHYTNNTIGNFYGEKFALEPFNSLTQNETSGFAREFKVTIPWLMWHKNPNCCQGQTFWVDPPGFDSLNLFRAQFIISNKNPDMNYPGIRYFNLWDTNPNADGYPSRVGKVFPDSKLVIFDDEEIVAALSYKSNRNWTLPAPRTSLVTPNSCSNDSGSLDGILTGSNQYMYVTYRLSNKSTFTNSLHCNYYIKIQGPNVSCSTLPSQNVAVRFGPEFKCLNYNGYSPTTTTTTLNPTTTTTTSPYITNTTTICPDICSITQGFVADTFEIICQKVDGNGRPDPDEWKVIDFTDLISATTINGYITEDSLINTTFVITDEIYESADYYDLGDYIDLTPSNYSGTSLNFGDEYYFYGILETNIQATIYEMVYKINLTQSQFQRTSNPTWTTGKKQYITEIGLYDSDKNLMIISKLQNPYERVNGTQQIPITLDF